MLAELAIGDPRSALSIALKGERIDQDGFAAPELDVVGTCIFERHALAQCDLLYSQGDQCRVLQLGEAPLIGIGDKWHPLRGYYAIRPRRQRLIQPDLPMGNQQLLLNQSLIEASLQKSVVLLAITGLDLSKKLRTTDKKESARISKGASQALLSRPGQGRLFLCGWNL